MTVLSHQLDAQEQFYQKRGTIATLAILLSTQHRTAVIMISTQFTSLLACSYRDSSDQHETTTDGSRKSEGYLEKEMEN